MVSDPHHAYPDPAFHFNADPDPAFHFNEDPDPHQGEANLRPLAYRIDPSGLYFEPPRLHFEPRQLLNFDLNADPDPVND